MLELYNMNKSSSSHSNNNKKRRKREGKEERKITKIITGSTVVIVVVVVVVDDVVVDSVAIVVVVMRVALEATQKSELVAYLVVLARYECADEERYTFASGRRVLLVARRLEHVLVCNLLDVVVGHDVVGRCRLYFDMIARRWSRVTGGWRRCRRDWCRGVA